MGKFILGTVVVLVLGVAVFVLGYAAGVTVRDGRVCERVMDASTQEQVCVVDGVRYVPEGSGDE